MTTAPHPPLAYGSWGRRLGAWIADLVIYAIAWMLLFLMLMIVSGTDEVHYEGAGTLLLFAGPSLLWDVGWIASPASGKPGHRLFGMRILRPDGSRVSVARALVRWLVRMTNWLFLGVEVFLSAITIAATERRQAIHDLAADTVAVQVVASGVGPARARHEPSHAGHDPFLGDDPDTEHRGPFL